MVWFDNTQSVLLLRVERAHYRGVWAHSGRLLHWEFFDSRLSEIISDAISGVKEQELLQIGNLAIVLASHSI